MHSTQQQAVYRKAADRRPSDSEVEAAKARLGAHRGEVESSTLLGQLSAIIFLLSLEPVGQHAWELIREAQADIAAFDLLMQERIARWTYSREELPEEAALDLNDVSGYALGRLGRVVNR